MCVLHMSAAYQPIPHLPCCRFPSSGRWSATGVVTTNQVARSHGSAGSFEITDPQVLDNGLAFSPRLAGAMTIRPGGPARGRRSMEGSVQRVNMSLHRNTSQDSLAATTSTPSWLGMSHDLRAQRAKEILLQVQDAMASKELLPWLCLANTDSYILFTPIVPPYLGCPMAHKQRRICSMATAVACAPSHQTVYRLVSSLGCHKLVTHNLVTYC